MRPIASALAVLSVLSVLGADPQGPDTKGPDTKGRKNLVANGDFEAPGKGGPASWQKPDGLTSFWAAAPGRKGKCIQIDTDVLVQQFRDREDAMEKARKEGREPPAPPKRQGTAPPKYDTVAGLDGVHFGCDPIPIDPEKHYLLEADVRADVKDGETVPPKLWIKAFAPAKTRDTDRERIVWKKSLNCEGATREWKTFRMVIPRDTKIPATVKSVRIYLYPFWPPATYHFDNVRLMEITEEEAKVFAQEKGLLEKSGPKK